MDTVSLKFFHGGTFKKGKNVDPDELCWFYLKELVEKCGASTDALKIYYLMSGIDFLSGLRSVYDDNEVRTMGEEWEENRPNSPISLSQLLYDADNSEDEWDSDPDYEVPDDLESNENEEEDWLVDYQVDDDISGLAGEPDELAHKLQVEAAEGKLSAQRIHTPTPSDENETLEERRAKRGLLVGKDTDFSKFQWQVGQRFTSRAEFKQAVTKFAIFQGRNLCVVAANNKRQQRIGVRCSEGCPFWLYASWDSRRGSFVVKRVMNEHTCLRNMEKNIQLKSTWLAEQLLDEFKAKPHWPAKEIIETIRRAYRVIVKKDFVYKVKYYAHRKLHGPMRDHYGKVG
ncbi:Large-conductance mechanosensitive channel, partial [Bienertia sinuspersici]